MMMIVEHKESSKYPPFVWAKDIQVVRNDDELLVSGIEVVSDEDVQDAADLVRAYRRAISRYGGAKRQGKNSPHIQFANADDLQKLSAFVSRYGPISVGQFSKMERPKKFNDSFEFTLTETVTVAHQSLPELERERLIYRSGLMLASELHQGKKASVISIREHISNIANNISDWPAQWERERKLRSKGLGVLDSPNWNFTIQNVSYIEHWMATIRLQ
jgi:hypothetical protein